jgi:hypothetical protein
MSSAIQGGSLGRMDVLEAHASLQDETSQRPLSRLAVLSDRWLLVALLLVVAFSPFEAGYPPLARIGATFTNLEVVILFLAAALVVRLLVEPAARQRLARMPLLLPVAALLAATVISYIFGEYKGQGINFTYRLLMGVVIFTSVFEACRTARRLLTALATLVGAGVVSATLGLLEYAPWIQIEPWLKMFKPMPTTVGGAIRLSGTFEYANGAALYFEMALPVVLALAALFSSRRFVGTIDSLSVSEGRRRVFQVLLFSAAAILTLALLLTLSRAALAGLLVALLVFAGIVALKRRSVDGSVATPTLFGSLAAVLVIMALGAAYIFLTQPVFRLRLTTENDRDWYNVSYRAGQVPQLMAGEWVTVPVTIRNEGPMLWRAEGSLASHLSYHWRSADQKTYVVFEGMRTALPHDLDSGESVTVDAVVMPPPEPGDYFLEWDMVQEHYAWYSAKSGTRSELTRQTVIDAPLDEQGAPRPRGVMPPPVAVGTLLESDTATIERTKLWSVAFAMFQAHPITGVGPDGFRNLYGKYANVTNWNTNIYTNNTYIEMFTNLGLLGGLSFLWLALLSMWKAFRSALRLPVDGTWILGVGATASVVAFYFHGLGDYFLFTTPLYTIFWLLLAASMVWPLLVRRQARQNANTRAEVT